MNDDNFLDAMKDLTEGYPVDRESADKFYIPNPSYAKGHSDGVAEERKAILAIVQQAVKHSEHERGVGLLKNLLDKLKWRNF